MLEKDEIPGSRELVDALPPEMRAKIKELSGYTLENFEFLLGDLLDHEEIEYMMDRISAIADMIRRADEDNDEKHPQKI